ncbi:transcription initiation factor TFIIIB [Brevibacillus ruminantium]|uniref:Transcription initiation factor TFIIIB n=1 Tax=Brevibacillus ruminantium TaxID=2950604 RepID=A0ABY4WEX4_9BACL|nr:transcription initiation factor TFIIIB [Brevibacillus ruminantium]USG64345.1 transcription initiation factor TFIIIB [Brevibacillus ruminantium]
MEQTDVICPKCKSSQWGRGKQSGYASVAPMDKIFSFNSALIHIICTDCGYILESYVEQPEKFKRKET